MVFWLIVPSKEMETPRVFWLLMMTVVTMKTVLAQSDIDMSIIETIVSNSEDMSMETAASEVDSEIKTSDSGFQRITGEHEMNNNFSYINLEAKISNEIDLENNSSEENIVKRSTATSISTESSNLDVSETERMLHSAMDSFDAKLTIPDREMEKVFVSENIPSSDLLPQPQANLSRILPLISLSEMRSEDSGMTTTGGVEVTSDSSLGKTSVSESSETDTLKMENSDAEKISAHHTESFSDGSSNSDYPDTEDSLKDSASLFASTKEFLTSRSFKTEYSNLETQNLDNLTKQTLKTDYFQTQPMSEVSMSSSATTEIPDFERKSEEEVIVVAKDFEEEESESRDSSSIAEEVTYANDRTVEGDGTHGPSIRIGTTKEQTTTNEPVTYAFEEGERSKGGIMFDMKGNVSDMGSAIDEAQDEEDAAGETFTREDTEDRTAHISQQHPLDEQTKTTSASDNDQYGKSTEITVREVFDDASEDTVTELHDGREDITLSSSEISKSTDVSSSDTESNSTRIPKRIQEPRYTETRYRPRPARPDPGYSYSDDSDSSRPYRPDDLLYSRGNIPASDSHTPFRREPDFSRPARPDPYVPVDDFSRHVPDYSRQSSSDSGVPKPYRPQSSFARPYVPQGSFGRPYRPDRDQTKHVSPPDYYSKTTEDLPLSSKPDAGAFFGASQSATDFSQSSYAGDYDGKTSESSEFEHQRPHSDVKPMVLTPDVFRPYRAPVDTRPSTDREGDISRPLRPIYLPSSSTVDDSDISKPSVPVFGSKPASKPDAGDDISRDASSNQDTRGGGDKSRPSGSYPRPGFGSNYGQTTGTSPKPFSPGTITLARNNLTRVEYIKADCFDNHMKVSIRFNGSFSGLVYSSGYSQDPTCSYINGSGRYHYEFFIRLNRCGTLGQQEVADQRVDTVTRRRQDRAQYLVNTVTVQYNPVIEEEIDEHFRVTCEYGYDFWKTVTFPVVSVETYLSRSSAMKVRTGSPVVFTLPPPQCNMEIRTGYGPSGSRVSGPVNVGDPLTLVIHMKSESAGFDILISNCFAHNGAQKRLQLIDSNGCVVQEKLISPFRGVSSPDRSQQVTLYSYLKAFRFTGSPALYIECDVHMCHGSCPPQRCYWRHLYKRSVENMTATSTEDPLISESVSLFQSLEVRNEESDRPNSLAVSSTDGHHLDEDMVCFRAAGFAAILASLLILLAATCLASICLCSRMRKMKTYFESPDTKHFIQFDINTQRK